MEANGYEVYGCGHCHCEGHVTGECLCACDNDHDDIATTAVLPAFESMSKVVEGGLR